MFGLQTVTRDAKEPHRFDVFEEFTDKAAFEKHQSESSGISVGQITKNVGAVLYGFTGGLNYDLRGQQSKIHLARPFSLRDLGYEKSLLNNM